MHIKLKTPLTHKANHRIVSLQNANKTPTKRAICYCFSLIYLRFLPGKFIYFLYFQFLTWTNWSLSTATTNITAAGSSKVTAIYLCVGWDKCDMMLCVNGLIPAEGSTGCGGQPDVAQAFVVFASFRLKSPKCKQRMRTTKKPNTRAQTNSGSYERDTRRNTKRIWCGQTAAHFVYCGI